MNYWGWKCGWKFSSKVFKGKEERKKHIKKLISIDQEIDKLTEDKIRIDEQIEWLIDEKKLLKKRMLIDKSIERYVGSHYRLYCYNLFLLNSSYLDERNPS